MTSIQTLSKYIYVINLHFIHELFRQAMYISGDIKATVPKACEAWDAELSFKFLDNPKSASFTVVRSFVSPIRTLSNGE